MSFRIQITPQALKQIAKLDKPARVRIERFLKEGLDRENPRAAGRPLVGSAFWRYRVGDYRLIVTIEDGILLVLVVAAAHRRDVYREP